MYICIFSDVMGVASKFGVLCCSRLSAAAVGRSWGGVASAAKPFAKQRHYFRQTYEQQPSKLSKTTWLGTLVKPCTTAKTTTTTKTAKFDVVLCRKL